jgi:hypothetical protein
MPTEIPRQNPFKADLPIVYGWLSNPNNVLGQAIINDYEAWLKKELPHMEALPPESQAPMAHLLYRLAQTRLYANLACLQTDMEVLARTENLAPNVARLRGGTQENYLLARQHKLHGFKTSIDTLSSNIFDELAGAAPHFAWAKMLDKGNDDLPATNRLYDEFVKFKNAILKKPISINDAVFESFKTAAMDYGTLKNEIEILSAVDGVCGVVPDDFSGNRTAVAACKEYLEIKLYPMVVGKHEDPKVFLNKLEGKLYTQALTIAPKYEKGRHPRDPRDVVNFTERLKARRATGGVDPAQGKS